MSDEIEEVQQLAEWKETAWKEIENKEAEVLQIMLDYIQAKINDIQTMMMDLSNKRSGFYDMQTYVSDLQKARGYGK